MQVLKKNHPPYSRSIIGAFLLALLSMLPTVQAEQVHLPGKFVWSELVTDDVATARHFYGGLFGWTFDEVDGYVTTYNSDDAVAGIFFHPRPKASPAKPRWLGYISVDDVSRVGRAVQAAGGSVRATQRKLPGQTAEAMVLADPEGALFGIAHFEEGDPPDYLADTGD